MSQTCNHECEGCNLTCNERTAAPNSFIESPNKLSSIKKVIAIISGKGGVGKSLINLQEKAIGSIKHLYDNMKHQLSYNLTKAQEKFVQMKIGIVKGLVNSMQDFIKDQQKKLDTCLEKLDNLSKEIQKDEEKLGKDSLNKEEKPIEKKEQNTRKKGGQKEQTEKKPSVLKKLKENQQKIKKEEKVRAVKAPKKDKGMEI